MRSTSLRFAFVAGLGLLLAPLVSDAKPTTTTRRSDTTDAPSDADERLVPGRVPKRLSSAKRLARANLLLSKLGYGKVSTLGDADRLTPRTPELANGARIHRASRIDYEAPSAQAPDAVFFLRDDGPMERSVVGVTWPTEVGKVYLIDCFAKVHFAYLPDRPEALRPKMEFDVDKIGRAEAVGANGHVLHAFAAAETTTYVRMEYRKEADASAWRQMAWYGCELVPVG